jgi:hypothetical protein
LRSDVAADACATRPLQTTHAGGASLTARQIHDGALATITDRYGIVVPSLAGLKQSATRGECWPE